MLDIQEKLGNDTNERQHRDREDQKKRDAEDAEVRKKMEMEDAARAIQAKWAWFQAVGRTLAKKKKGGRKGKGKKKK
jgi:hypothetical protein